VYSFVIASTGLHTVASSFVYHHIWSIVSLRIMRILGLIVHSSAALAAVSALPAAVSIVRGGLTSCMRVFTDSMPMSLVSHLIAANAASANNASGIIA